MPDLKLMLKQMITGWQNENIPIRKGVDELSLQRFEHKYGVKLPVDMREYFSTVNGMGDDYDDADFFRFWPLEEVQLVREYCPTFAERFPQSANWFLFFDHSIDLSMYAIGLSHAAAASTPIYEIFSNDGRDNASLRFLCNSFTEFAALYATDPKKLY